MSLNQARVWVESYAADVCAGLRVKTPDLVGVSHATEKRKGENRRESREPTL